MKKRAGRWRYYGKSSVDVTVMYEDNMTAVRHLHFLAFWSEMELGWGWIASDTLLKLPCFKSCALVTRLSVLRKRKFGTAFFAVDKPFFWSSVYGILLTVYDVYVEGSVRDLSKSWLCYGAIWLIICFTKHLLMEDWNIELKKYIYKCPTV